MDFQDHSDKLLHDNSASDKQAQEKRALESDIRYIVENQKPNPIGSVDHTILTVNSQINLKLPWYERLLYFCATPFSYPTGFYFKGKNSFHMKSCGLCTIMGILFLMASSFVLFEPNLMDSDVQYDIQTSDFNTLHRPATVDEHQKVFDFVPSGLQ